MSKMKKKTASYLGGAVVLGLSILAVSCAGFIEPPAPAPPSAVVAPPAIPHSLEGRSNCLLCHEKGVGGAPQYPASHVGRPSDVCIACHIKAPTKNGETALASTPKPPAAIHPTPTSPGETAPTAVSARELFGNRCAACHGANRQGVPGFTPALTPESLAALSDAEIRNTILNGRTGTAMPPFKGTLSTQEIDALLELIKRTSP